MIFRNTNIISILEKAHRALGPFSGRPMNSLSEGTLLCTRTILQATVNIIQHGVENSDTMVALHQISNLILDWYVVFKLNNSTGCHSLSRGLTGGVPQSTAV